MEYFMSVPDEVRRDAERTGELVRKKLLEIMELQADIDTLLRGDKPTPFGAKRWEYACLEALQRMVAVTATQFVLFEPVEMVEGNGELRDAADRLIRVMMSQMKTLKTKK